MTNVDPRAALERIVAERGDDYANLSRLIGRNPAYIQQFIKRGTPRRLSENDRAKLARYLSIDERLLGAPPRQEVGRAASIFVPRLAIGASAGPGALVDAEKADAHFAFDARWLRELGAGDPQNLSIIRVAGDSMAPTLADGDDILVDQGDGANRVRDGIYVLRRDDVLSVKRLALNPAGKRVSIKSDNPDYRDFVDIRLGAIGIIGRVIWTGRRLR